jgi:heavy metal sensor kinase
MSRLPLRVRLTAAFALAMAVVLLAAGWFVYARVASDLGRALDEALRGRAQDIGALVDRGGSLDDTRGALVEGGELFAELIAADGRVLDATAPIGATVLLTDAQLERARGGATFADRPSVPGLDDPARMLAVPLERDGERLVLVVGATRESRTETLDSLRTAFLIGAPLALVLASLAGYLIAGAALRPIESMRSRAAEISTTTLDERLPVPPARDEVSRLGETLNAMLGRIEAGVERERRFVADASHELRTPLALLKAELELALRRKRSPAELEQAIASALSEADRLARIADDLLLLARSDHGGLPLQAAPADPAELLRSTAERFAARAAAAGRELTVRAGEPGAVTVDRLRLEQALGNLVDNALRHGAGRVELEAVPADGATELHVLDEGPGFPPEFVQRAFERFSRPDEGRAEDGTGLGLAIVQTIAEAHGGEVHIATRSGRGSDIWITVPAAPPESVTPSEPRRGASRPSRLRS